MSATVLLLPLTWTTVREPLPLSLAREAMADVVLQASHLPDRPLAHVFPGPAAVLWSWPSISCRQNSTPCPWHLAHGGPPAPVTPSRAPWSSSSWLRLLQSVEACPPWQRPPSRAAGRRAGAQNGADSVNRLVEGSGVRSCPPRPWWADCEPAAPPYFSLQTPFLAAWRLHSEFWLRLSSAAFFLFFSSPTLHNKGFLLFSPLIFFWSQKTEETIFTKNFIIQSSKKIT